MIVLVAPEQILEPVSRRLLHELQSRFHIPVMLITRQDKFWTGAEAYSQMDTQPFMMELSFLRDDDLEWNDLRDKPEEELPF